MISPSTIVLVTGANSGVGYAITQVVSGVSENYHIIMACRNLESAENALTKLRATKKVKGTIRTLHLDVNNLESITAAATEIKRKYGRVDVLINNAAISYNDISVEAYENTMRTNVIGPALVTKTFEHLLMKSKSPYSLYISSGMGSFDCALDKTGLAYNGGWIVYRQSKAALNMWVVEECKVLADKGVKTFAVCPGYVVSNLRGRAEDQRSGWGAAGDPTVSGQTVLSIIEGKRDMDVGKLVHKDGVYAW